MKSSFTYFMIACFILCLGQVQGQNRSNARVKLAPRKIHKLPKVDLELIEKNYPRSYLYKVNKSSITLINRAYHNKTFKPVYFQGDLNFDEIKSITIHSRQRRFKTNIWGAAIGGIAGYFVGKAVAREDFNQISIEILDQRPSTGFVEPIIGAIVGASVGIAIGDLFTPVTLDKVNGNTRQTSLYLRGETKRKKKKRR